MVMAHFRRFAWMLLLVLFAGVSLPMLASAGPSPSARRSEVTTVAHVHADGSAHTHTVKVKVPPAGLISVGPTASVPDCTCCLTNAACALSCFGMALLPTTTDWAWSSTLTPWFHPVIGSPSGVGLPGDIDPPRLVSVS